MNSAGPAVLVELGGDDEQLGVGGARDERLDAVEHEAAVRRGARVVLQLERIEQRPRLEHRERRGRGALADERGQVGRLLVGVAPQAERGRRRRPAPGTRRRCPCRPGRAPRSSAPTVTAERCSTAPPSSSGTPTIVSPSSLAWAQQLGRRCAAPRRPPRRRGAARPSANSRTESRSICCSSVGVRSNRSVRPARGWRAGRERFCAAANVRPALAAVRAVVFEAPVQEPLGGLAQAEPVEQVGGGQPVQRAQADGHAALGEVLLRRHRAGNHT